MLAAFEDLFGARPTHWVRAPGRVNLIGEHVDYNGLPVVPMAIQREVRIACRPRSDARVRVVSTQTEFDPRAFDVGRDIEPFATGDWGNYVKAAARVAAREYGLERGMDALVDSTVPVAAGLSSSSALVVAVAWALLRTHDVEADRLALARAVADGERYVGTQGGGMDQAVALGAEPGAAVRIDFDPLALTHVPVPQGWQFVVAHSLRRAEKSGAAQQTYNRRTAECAEALQAVGRELGTSADGYRALMQQVTTADLLAAAAALPPALGARFRHVVTEHGRVARFEIALRDGDVETAGALMDASHVSLRDDYGVSTPDLDLLVTIARRAGATGARLTGAGLGGCIVALCTAETAAPVLRAVATQFYRARGCQDDVDDLAFAVSPAAGASAAPIGSEELDAGQQAE